MIPDFAYEISILQNNFSFGFVVVEMNEMLND